MDKMKISVLKNTKKPSMIDDLISKLLDIGYQKKVNLFLSDDESDYDNIINSNIIFINYDDIRIICNSIELLNDFKYTGLIVLTRTDYISSTEQIAEKYENLNIVHSKNKNFIGITDNCNQRMVNMLAGQYEKYFGLRPSIVASGHSERS